MLTAGLPFVACFYVGIAQPQPQIESQFGLLVLFFFKPNNDVYITSHTHVGC